MAKEKVKNCIDQANDPTKKRSFYKYILVDLDDTSIIIDRLGRFIKTELGKAKMRNDVKLYAFGSTSSEAVRNNCKKGKFTFFDKPSKYQILDVLRHMAEDELQMDLQNKKIREMEDSAEEDLDHGSDTGRD